METINARLSELNLQLPPPGAPKANYQLVHQDGNLLYLSGHLPFKPDGTLVLGTCAPSYVLDRGFRDEDWIEGKEESKKYISTQEGYEAAKHCALNLLSTVQSYLSEHVTTIDTKTGTKQSADLSNIVKVIKLFGIVRSHDEFEEQHLVMNGASDLLGQVLGKDVGGSHARSAIGTNSLPLGIAVEVEMIVKISL